MKNERKDLQLNSIHQTNKSGPLKVVGHVDDKMVEIEMLNTGYKATVTAENINRGAIKDRLMGSVSGIGFIGTSKRGKAPRSSKTKAYVVWSSMFARCYNESKLKRQPTYMGCTVCDEWHDFQVFAEWFDLNYVDGLQIDKDIRVEGNRIYSPETCKFVTLRENVVKAQAKNYTLINPTGLAVDVYNLVQFCRDEGLPRGNMARMICGVTKTCMGWSV